MGHNTAATCIGFVLSCWMVCLLSVHAHAQPIEEGPVGEEAPVPELIPPKLKTFIKATYPPQALKEEIEATVILLIDIDTEGRVEKVVLAEPTLPDGYGFDEAAIAAVRQFVFEPATEAEIPIPVQVTYRYRFELSEKKQVLTDKETITDEPSEPEPPGEINYTGLVLERGTRDPLVGTIVTVFRDVEGEEPIGFEAVTDVKGNFAFIDLAPGVWKVLIETDGYYPVRTSEKLAENERTNVVYFVEKGSYNKFDVLVEGARVRKEVSKSILRAEEIEKIPGTWGDPIKVVRNLPGVARVNPFSGEIVVRGSSPEDTKLYVSGVEVPIIYHFGGLRSVIPLGMVDSITFYPGNFSTYYGRAIGGVLDVDLKELSPEQWHGYMDVNIFDSGAFLEMPVTEELSIAFAARRSYIDVVLEAVIPDDAGINLIAAPAYYDWQVLADWRPHRDHKLKLFLFGSSDEFKLILNDPAVDVEATSDNLSLTIGSLRGIFEYEWTPNERLSSVTKVSTGSDQTRFGAFGLFTFNFDLYQPTFRETLTYIISERATMTAGLDVVWSKLDLTVDAPPLEQEGDANETDSDTENIFYDGKDLRSRDVGGFFELELKLTDDLRFIPGARVDYFETMNEVTFDPRLTVRYDIASEWAVKGGIGLFHQSPPADQISDSGFGNPDLGPEAAVHYSAGVEWTPFEYLVVDTTLFYKDMFGMVSGSDDLVERNGELVPEVYNNKGEGRVYGMELLIRHEFANNFFGWISYTLSRAERLDYGETKYRLFDFDQTHILTAIGSYRLPRNWEIGLRWRYVTGSPTTINASGVFNVDSGEYEPVPGEVNGARLPAFHQLDLRIDKRWIYDTWNLNAYIDIQNVYNYKNAEGYTYNYNFSERGVIQSLPILPIIGVKAEF